MDYFGTNNKSVMYIASEDYEASSSREVGLKKGEKVTGKYLYLESSNVSSIPT